MSFCLKIEAAGLSFAARAVLATVAALVTEHQHEQIPARDVKACLALSEEAWASARDELYEAGVLFEAHDPTWDKELVSLMRGANILQNAIGHGGRPHAKHWAELTEQVFEEQGRTCLYCAAAPATTVDHVVPIIRGGSNHLANLVPACKSCNSSKGAKPFDEWWPTMERARRLGSAL